MKSCEVEAAIQETLMCRVLGCFKAAPVGVMSSSLSSSYSWCLRLTNVDVCEYFCAEMYV